MIGVQDSKHVDAVCSADESLCGKNAEDVMQADGKGRRCRSVAGIAGILPFQNLFG